MQTEKGLEMPQTELIPDQSLSVRPSFKSCLPLTSPTVVGPVLSARLLGAAPFLKDDWDTGADAGGGDGVGYTCHGWESRRSSVTVLCLVAFQFPLIACSAPHERISSFFGFFLMFNFERA